MAQAAKKPEQDECSRCMMAVKDSLDVLQGRWKLPILLSLRYGNKRFMEISREVNGITDKVLSKELKELEMNQLITRTIHATFPPTVEYAITDHGNSLDNVISALRDWGLQHRKQIIGK
ncbi:MAG TPA: transcriptional regulator [Bacteroidetes bacterium]|nr:transcriptional regulator [Bacteroidota bacterium]